MFWLLVGIAIGLIVGWNLLPQPKWIKAKYDRVSAKVTKWLLGLLVLVVILPGCSATGIIHRDIGWAKERAMAEIAIASVTSPAPIPDNTPKVGDKCPDCNDPPGACGVGRVGDGRTCDRCNRCGGDGKIDDRDIVQIPHPIPDPIPNGEPVQKEITLHMTQRTKSGWPSKWYAEQRQSFESRGWFVRVIMEPDSATQVAYFDVVAPDGEVLQFFDSITPADVRHLETR
jgi:hypothetical protein